MNPPLIDISPSLSGPEDLFLADAFESEAKGTSKKSDTGSCHDKVKDHGPRSLLQGFFVQLVKTFFPVELPVKSFELETESQAEDNGYSEVRNADTERILVRWA